MIDEERVIEHRARALSPDHPVIRGTAQNPDVYFQARETVNPFYAACPEIVQRTMDRFAELTGRRYGLFEYHGAPDAERVIVLMGSGCEAAHETVDFLNAQSEKVGVLKVRLYRPFDAQALRRSVARERARIAVLDRTKEPGSGRRAALSRLRERALRAGPRRRARGRRALRFVLEGIHAGDGQGGVRQSRATVAEESFHGRHRRRCLAHEPRFRSDFSIEPDDVVRAQFFGLGSDGTVGANKESIKIIGENTDHFAQGYFVYDSKKAGAMTISHLRFGPRPIRSTYLITKANFVACHQPFLLETLRCAARISRRAGRSC